MDWIIVPVLAALAATFATATVAVAMRRGLLRLQDDVEEAWREFAQQLEKRQQHVAAVATLCGRLMHYELGAVARVAATGGAVLAASARRDIPALAAAEKAQHAAVATLVDLAGNYRQFAKSQAFAALVDRLATLDGRVADRRERYNEAASLLNLRCGAFPNRLVAQFSGFGRTDLLVPA